MSPPDMHGANSQRCYAENSPLDNELFVPSIIIPEEGHVIKVRNVGYWLKNGVILLFLTLNNKHHIGSKLAISCKTDNI